MLPLLLLPLLWGGSLQQDEGFELQVPERVTVQEGLCVLVPCTFLYPGKSPWDSSPLYISWFWSGDRIQYDPPVVTNNPNRWVKTETRGRFHLLGDPMTNSCTLSIRDAKKRDTGTYIFHIERDYYEKHTYQQKTLNVQVTDLTEKPSIHIPEPLQLGHPTELTCSLPGSCEGGTPLTFSWKGDALKLLDPKTLQSPVLTITPRLQDHGTYLTCQVTLQRSQVTMEMMVQLNVSYAPGNVSISISQNGAAFKVLGNSSSLLIPEGQSLRLLCAADSYPPAELSWFQGPSVLNASSIFPNGVLDLPQVGIGNEGEFTCRAQNAHGFQNVSLSLSVFYPPQLRGPACSWEGVGLRCGCSARAWPAPSVRWRVGDELLEANSSNASVTVTSSSAGPWANSSLRLRAGPGSILRLGCEAWNGRRNQSVSVLLLPGKSSPKTEMLLGALVGVGAMALFSLCVCLAFYCIVKARGKHAVREPRGMDDEDPVMGTVTWSSRQTSCQDSPHDQVSPSENGPPLRKEQEHHYASLTFHEMKLQERTDQETTSITEYSEIKKSK